MSRIFGPCIQQGYIVPDVKEAAKHWIDIGVGPFFLDEGLTLPGTYHGEKYEFGLTPAFSYSGDQQVELIQPDGPAPSIYKDYLAQVPGGGLQHVAFWAEDPDGKAQEVIDAGHPFEVVQAYDDITNPGRNRHLYLDSTENPGTMVQLMMRDPLYIALFGKIEQACNTWDGSEPLRSIRPLLADLL